MSEPSQHIVIGFVEKLEERIRSGQGSSFASIATRCLLDGAQEVLLVKAELAETKKKMESDFQRMRFVEERFLAMESAKERAENNLADAREEIEQLQQRIEELEQEIEDLEGDK